jgi:hypothetical protein
MPPLSRRSRRRRRRLLLLLALLGTGAMTAGAVRIAPRHLRSYPGITLDGTTTTLVQDVQKQRRVLVTAAQLLADIVDGTPESREQEQQREPVDADANVRVCLCGWGLFGLYVV